MSTGLESVLAWASVRLLSFGFIRRCLQLIAASLQFWIQAKQLLKCGPATSIAAGLTVVLIMSFEFSTARLDSDLMVAYRTIGLQKGTCERIS
jgi:hypothetical protein